MFDRSKKTFSLLNEMTFSHDLLSHLVGDLSKDKFDDVDAYFNLG